MGLIENIKTFLNDQKKKIVKYLVKNKVFISAVIKYINIAYVNYEGKQKMEEAIKFLLILVNQAGIANEYSDDIATAIEKTVQAVYDTLKTKGLLV